MEYLSPGVFIEETSFRAKSIEGVSTSTAGFVGRASGGSAGRPVLVTSFADFQRVFGAPYAAPTHPGEHLGHAARGFFDNGGRRAWIVRVLGDNSGASTETATHGIVVGVRRTVAPEQSVLPLTTLRGIAEGTAIRVFWRPSPSVAYTMFAATVAGYDSVAGEVTLTAATGTDVTLRPGDSYIELDGVPPAAAVETGKQPVWTALDDGEAGNELAVQTVPADRPPVRIVADVAADGDSISLASVSGFYVGAIAEIDTGTARVYREVTAVDGAGRIITLASGIGAATSIDVSAVDAFVRVLEMNVNVLRGGTILESFAGLSWNPRQGVPSFGRYYERVVNDETSGSKLMSVEVAIAPQPTAVDAPATPRGQALSLTGGADGDPPTPVQLVGQDLGPGQRTGIQALSERDDIAIVAVPGVTDEVVQSALLQHCELDKYRIAVLDGVRDEADVSRIEIHRNAYDSKYGAYYAPWLRSVDLATGSEITVPPSGHVAGIYARTDNERGVHKAPANEVVRGIIDLELRFTTGEQDVLNPQGVNLIREFTGRGRRVWGARTTSSDSEWKYVNIRRYFIYIEASIDRGTQWVVFEPNGEALWARVRQTVESFLRSEWRAGRLMGTKEEEAFFVRCDRTTMSQDDLDNGRLICEIGIAPIFPAEFVIFRIGQFTASVDT